MLGITHPRPLSLPVSGNQQVTRHVEDNLRGSLDMRVFLMTTNPESEKYLREIAEEMSNLFGITYREAVARVNREWRDLSFERSLDLITHELPEHWAYRLYYGEVAYWDPSADRSKWVAREAPPHDSPYWTVHDSSE